MRFLVCNSGTNVLIYNGRFRARFAEKLRGIKVRLQTTNLGVRSSNLFGRATFPAYWLTGRLTGQAESLYQRPLPLRPGVDDINAPFPFGLG
jgi:hypothetical protein